MQQHKDRFVILLAVISVQLAAGRWVSTFYEKYHRPTYYNTAHNSSKHVDYNATALFLRDYNPSIKKTLPPFDPSTHRSFYVNVLYKGSVICAGALISRRMIITSSRCFLANELEPSHEFKAKDMSIETGNHFGQQARVVYPVKAFFLPAGKFKHEDVHKIALLALHTKLQKGTYRYIELYRRVLKPKMQVLVSYVDSYTRDITLLSTKVISQKQCQKAFREIGKRKIPFYDDLVCVKSKKHGCSARPGDPLIVFKKLAGINIYGENCDELEGNLAADVYYTMRYAVPFIQRATDMLRAFTGTGPYAKGYTTKRYKLYADTTPDSGLNGSVITESTTLQSEVDILGESEETTLDTSSEKTEAWTETEIEPTEESTTPVASEPVTDSTN
ncbi:hypothetical protein AWZ03_003528 [Drosophila navojoa]|uniref:Peptidase S1 domain-containing protein n=1 Tax=Drosophila navojoa TaxID=7232 RepID=A0A484BMQ2_DRONA|nr:uncharacterized protein LOC115561957 [Drosophila navojoa]TDG50018.1 hypothetical protein AWZ03_003528 [Drosophila navojoa]